MVSTVLPVRDGAGFFWWVVLVAGLQVGQALRCSSHLMTRHLNKVPFHLSLGSAVPVPKFLGT